MTEIRGVGIAPNWTSAAGALEGVLAFLGAPLPRHAVMGLTGHAWHACLQREGDVVALPGGIVDLDWAAMVERYARTGYRFERYGSRLAAGDDAGRQAAIDWAIGHLDSGRPLIGFDFHLHEFGTVFGYDRERGGFLVDDILAPDLGTFSPWAEWPSPAIGWVELFAPVEPIDSDPEETILEALRTALDVFAGRDGPPGQARGTAALEAWADAMDHDLEVDRAGNAYQLSVIQAARLDGATFISDVADHLEPLAAPLRQAEQALFEEGKTLAPLITLFPFPAGGHGNVVNPTLRRAAAMTLRRAANWERQAARAIESALELAGA